MSPPPINRSWKAAPGYRDQFPLADRLRDLTSYGVMSGRLTTEEALLVEGATGAAQDFLSWQWMEWRIKALLSGLDRYPASQAAEPADADRAAGEMEAEAC
jgi:hypothetical protein